MTLQSFFYFLFFLVNLCVKFQMLYNSFSLWKVFFRVAWLLIAINFPLPENFRALCTGIYDYPTQVFFVSPCLFCYYLKHKTLLFLNQGRWARLLMEKPCIIKEYPFIVLYLDSWFKVETLSLVMVGGIYPYMEAHSLMRISI